MASCEKKYTILLLSAPIGSGHKLAAQALEQSFALADNVQVVHGRQCHRPGELIGKQ